MEQVISKVIVVGAAGNLGKPVVEALLATGRFTVSALTRTSSKSTFPHSVNAIKSDYTHGSLVAAFTGQDAVVCTVATSSLTSQRQMIDAAVEAGVKRFIPSEFGFDTEDDRTLEVAPCTIMKKDPVEYLKSREDKISWTSIVNGLWLEWCSNNPDWPWWSVKNHSFVMFDDGDAHFDCSTLEQAGRAVAATLLPEHIEKTKNQYVFVHSTSVTQKELLSIMEDTSGSKFNVVPNKVEDINAQGKEIFYRHTKDKGLDELGDVPEFQISIVLLISSGIFGLGGVADFAEKTKYWMEALGLEEEDPKDIMRRVIAPAAVA